MGNPDPEYSIMQPEEEHSGDGVNQVVAAQMENIVGRFSTTMQEMRVSQYQELTKVFNKKLMESLKGIGAAFDSQVELEKAANAKQIKEVAEEATLMAAGQTMKAPQKRARPNPPMSVKNTPTPDLEESKDPVVPRGLILKPQPEAHRAQNLPTLQQHVRAARDGQGIPLD